tara:strand:+ start:258 stop:563 length:306 start_codon:yes stop_codon:yes gene_type:complete
MSVNYRNKNNFNVFNINSRFFSFLFFSLTLLTLYLIINISNDTKIIKRDKIPLILTQIQESKDNQVIEITNRDKLLRTHIKDEAKKNGMIKANYSNDIIKW